VDADILAGLESGKIAAYFTDFPTGDLAGKPGVIGTPHLGASTPEAEDNCAVMACRQLAEYLENGNIVNSVNMPCVRLAKKKANRVGIFYRNDAETDGAVLAFLAGADLAKGTRGDVAYVLGEKDSAFDLDKINAVGGVIRSISY
jgi:D-3-phosphoglycerate dehydrogenase